MGNQYSEDLFRSIDTIVSARMSNLPYDQTMIAYISDTSQSAEGIYKAKHESLEVIAYSENTEYQLGDQVYISVPRADYKQKKIILGRIPQDKQQVVKVRPFENYVPCTENFNKINKEVSIIANSDSISLLNQKYNNYKEVCSYSFNLNKNYKQNAGFDLLGLKASIAANVENGTYAAISGDYGLLLHLEAYDLTSMKDSADNIMSLTPNSIYFELSVDDMVNINHYNTYGYCGQEKVFNIKNLLIKNLTLYLVQYKNFLTETGILIPKDQEFLISCKDVEITLGYEGIASDFKNGKLFIYTPDGILYNSNVNINKEIYSRLVIYDNDQIEVYAPPKDYQYVYWYKYDSSITDYNEILETTSYKKIENANSLILNILIEATQTPLKNQRYCLAISKDGYKWHVAESLIFINNVNLINSEVFDAINGFQVSTTGDNEGIFNLYGQDNLLLNDAESFRVHNLRLSYNATAENRQLRAGDIIKWKIPSDRTMLLPVDKFINEKVLTDNDLDNDKTFLLPFKIKNLYNPNYTQNTIQCELTLVEDDGSNTVLTYNKELFFGPSGSSGNDYILVLELCKKNNPAEKVAAILDPDIDDEQTCKNKYTIMPHLYNYAMKEIPITKDIDITYSWLNTDKQISRQYAADGDLIGFEFIETIPVGARIIKGEIKKYGVSAYLPIATKFDAGCDYMEGCKTIVYDITGKKPIYQKFDNKVYSYNATEKYSDKNQILELKYYGADGKDYAVNEDTNNLPQLSNKVIIPPSVYSSVVNNMFLNIYLQGTPENELIWVQPILIIKNKYPSAMTNIEMNPTKFGNWIVKQNLVGQIKESNGLLIGQLSDKDESINRFGIIGSNENGDFFRVLMDTGEIYIRNGIGNIENSTIAEQALKLVSSKDNEFNIGSANLPVYFANGIPQVCDHPLIPQDTINILLEDVRLLKKNFEEEIEILKNEIEELKNVIQELKS